MTGRVILAAVGLGILCRAAGAADWPQWRGPQRTGVSQETGLLKSWPQGGPKLLWRVSGAGGGYSTPAVVGNWLFTLGNEGNDNEFVQARAVGDGKVAWTTRIGRVGNPDQQPSYPGCRSTVTVEG
ncbi:MAG: hypothetical protein FJX77_07300, partial [Armatimonadetes bacterium]|nr:hypothetical protein [Armatimonadota bacterium]